MVVTHCSRCVCAPHQCMQAGIVPNTAPACPEQKGTVWWSHTPFVSLGILSRICSDTRTGVSTDWEARNAPHKCQIWKRLHMVAECTTCRFFQRRSSTHADVAACSSTGSSSVHARTATVWIAAADAVNSPLGVVNTSDCGKMDRLCLPLRATNAQHVHDARTWRAQRGAPACNETCALNMHLFKQRWHACRYRTFTPTEDSVDSGH